jgi:hypothetical protein
VKPAPFEYSRPANLDEACAMLAAGDDARLIAGGQTLVPLMAMRLARPKRLIDIARIAEHKYNTTLPEKPLWADLAIAISPLAAVKYAAKQKRKAAKKPRHAV